MKGLMAIVATLPAVLACVPDPQPAVARMSGAEAEVFCTRQANAYANRPLMIPDANGTIQIGLQAELPSSFYVNDFYKRCYRANAGQRPETIPKLEVYG